MNTTMIHPSEVRGMAATVADLARACASCGLIEHDTELTTAASLLERAGRHIAAAAHARDTQGRRP